MPRFYFDTHDGAKHTRDDEGLTLSGLDAAREHALRAAGEMVRTALPDRAHRFRAVEVLGEDRHPLLTVQVTVEVQTHGPKLPSGIRRRLSP
jgi:hypothetical protein